jgi:3-oxoacyl-[acyl-carrier protein] reductase
VEDRIALVTGASKGIGAAAALALGRAGFKVALHFRSDPALAESLAAEIPGSMTFQFDLAKPGECESLLKSVKEKMGSIDVLVNNAGMSIDQLIAFAKPDDFDTLLSTNLKPVFLLCKGASKMMIRKKAGSIINITSVVGHTGNAGQSMYVATKAAITGLTMSIAKELAPFGIRANCIAPGFIETDMTVGLSAEIKAAIIDKIPLKRLGRPDDIGNAVEFLASDKSAYISGSTIHVNGGMYTT